MHVDLYVCVCRVYAYIYVYIYMYVRTYVIMAVCLPGCLSACMHGRMDYHWCRCCFDDDYCCYC